MTEQRLRACVCAEFREAVAEDMVGVMEFQRGRETRLMYMLPHPGGDMDEARLMVFCPFCAGTVGDGWAVAADVGN